MVTAGHFARAHGSAHRQVSGSLRKRLFEAQLEKYIDKPDYRGKAAFVDTFSEDFSKMLEAYKPEHGGKLFVFIDDLDRCEAPKAADLMQAINLMIGDGNSLIFILGLDRAKVAAAIAFKFREIIPYLDPSVAATADPDTLRSFGDAFLEKFIQLSFRLPVSSSESQARKFIDSLITDAASPAPATSHDADKLTREDADRAAEESTRRALRIESGAESQRIRDIVMMVREVLDYSPRRIKTFLNAFRLALYIASAQGLLDIDNQTGKAEVTPERLGKFLVLTSRYPRLRLILDKDPDFLNKMEERVAGRRSLGKGLESDLIQEWLELPGVRKLMSFSKEDKTYTAAWKRQYSMENFPYRKFNTILPSVPPPEESQSESAHARGAKEAAIPAGETAGTGFPGQYPERNASLGEEEEEEEEEEGPVSKPIKGFVPAKESANAAPDAGETAAGEPEPPLRSTAAPLRFRRRESKPSEPESETPR